MATWAEFEGAAPQLAGKGRALQYQYGPRLGYLAIVRPDGGPRVHPFCPRKADSGPTSCDIHPKVPIFGAILASLFTPALRLTLTTSSSFGAMQSPWADRWSGSSNHRGRRSGDSPCP